VTHCTGESLAGNRIFFQGGEQESAASCAQVKMADGRKRWRRGDDLFSRIFASGSIRAEFGGVPQ
jgi:hypothetical protein